MLRLNIKQPFACYRVATVGNPILSYPLPPPATVFGALRNITECPVNSENTQIAITGKSIASFSHIVNHVVVTQASKSKTNIIKTQMLHDIELNIFIKSCFEEEIAQNANKLVRLGRSEDIISQVKVFQEEEEELIDNEKLSNLKIINSNDYAYFVDGNIVSISYQVPFDTIESYVKQGIYRYHKKNLLYMPVSNLIKHRISANLSVSKKGYYFLEWLN